MSNEEIARNAPIVDEPIQFVPIYQKRAWGGRNLEDWFNRQLPDDAPYGESWELVDRPETQSVVANGDFAGLTLGELWTHRRRDIFGTGAIGDRFPLLFKILDAKENLSIQVHPPEDVAKELGGEPKTEVWFVAHAEPGAKLYIGVKNGVDRALFEQSINDGTTSEAIHELTPEKDDSILIESGRLHSIGAGLLIFEIQQNSDTTYRVFDWNRL
ncbi:MAG: type I phosphomannose isomerase catalytic subunit, partial [Verrucomicrobiota bacterium]